jgi:hypothetical protein
LSWRILFDVGHVHGNLLLSARLLALWCRTPETNTKGSS